MANDFFYDQQIRRYLLQFNRIFSTFKWKTGITKSGLEEFRTVPCLLASSSRHVQSLMRNGKENTINTVPQFATYIDSVRIVPERRQIPDYERSTKVAERKFDEVTGRYSPESGYHYQVDSYMPVPYDLIMKCELVTSNMEQKCQLMEQIMIIFNPMIDLQTSDNVIDWTSLGTVELTDIQWSSNSFPQGEENLDVTTMTFNVRAWITPPAKVKKQSVIQEIIANIGAIPDMKDAWQPDGSYFTHMGTMAQTVVTPGQLAIEVTASGEKDQYVARLLSSEGEKDVNGNDFTWVTLLAEYDQFRRHESQLVVIDEYDGLDTKQIRAVGTLDFTKDQNVLSWTINPNSLPPMNPAIPNIIDVIDPTKKYPGSSGFPSPQAGDRYIVYGQIFSGGKIWGMIDLKGQAFTQPGDVIEYDGEKWNLVHSVVSDPKREIWSYLMSEKDYIRHWDGEWKSAIQARYNPGNWRLRL